MDYFLSMWRWAWHEKDQAKKWARTTMIVLMGIDFFLLVTFVTLVLVGK